MTSVSLAFFWHQHQPYYPDDVSGENPMPWVRLHGTKDYYGMALHIKEVPEFRCTINLVPSLLLQIERYTEHGKSDRHLDVSRMESKGMTKDDVRYMLDNFFMANVDSMIRPYPRYFELYMRRGFGIDPVERAVPRFSARDLRDLQVWSNLTWMHPLAFEVDSDLKAFRDKGQYWTEDEKNWLLDKQMEILRQVIPLHRELSEGGQVELTTTPFFHPILPLLWDKRSARQAMPHCQLPKALDSYKEDACHQLKTGVEYHKKLFGQAPIGMWPSEGSVSHDIIPAIAEQGIEWIATDEEILAASTNGWVSRDGQGHLRHPEMLFRPWRIDSGGKQVQIVFRDHAMSDLIGFHYQRGDSTHGAMDLLNRVEAIGRAVDAAHTGQPALVPIILDGENCWEYYYDGGVTFLRTLYRQAAAHPRIEPVKIGEALHKRPATDRIQNLFAGSWISHNFAIWIGHHEDNTAWDLLHQTREFLKQETEKKTASPEILKRAWEEMYIAEGSDWFWWFGDDHSSAQDALFDQLFRRHLQNVYQLLGVSAPSVLNQPITSTERRTLHTKPTGFLPVKVNGRKTYFEWISAGRYISRSERGTMTLVTEGLVRELFFGFDPTRLLLRVDTVSRAVEDLARATEMRIHFVEPKGAEIRIGDWKTGTPTAKLFRNNKLAAKATTEVSINQIFEFGILLSDLGVNPGDSIHFSLDLLAEEQSLQRVPHEGTIELAVPSPDFELIMWQA
ncbi:MAG: glycoside hydrolase family 57 protein [Planctomycetaceae bacterium]